MADIRDFLNNWEELPYSFEGRDLLPDGDEIWRYDTLWLGLPVIWLKHPNNTFDSYVVHTPGYNQSTGEHWCFECHRKMLHQGSEWVCPECSNSLEDYEVDYNSAPTEEASYSDELEPESEWYD